MAAGDAAVNTECARGMTGVDMKENPRQDALAAIFMLLAVLPFAATIDEIYVDPFDPGFSARDFPSVVVGAMLVLSVVLLARSIVKARRRKISWIDWRAFIPVLRFVLPMVVIGSLYVWGTILFQYFVPTVLVTVAALGMFGNRGYGRLVAFPCLLALAFHGIFFGLLGLYEPPGTLVQLDPGSVAPFLTEIFSES